MTPLVNTNTEIIAFSEQIQTKPAQQTLFYLIQNIDLVSNGSCKKLCLTRIERPDHFDSKIQNLARVNLLDDQRSVAMHEKIAALDFNLIIFNQQDSTLEISSDSVAIIALSDEEYEIMVDEFLKTDVKEAESNDSSPTDSIRFFPKALIKTVSQYFKNEQEIVAFFRLIREEQLARVDEDTRERQTKERDKRWNQRMDYWIQKDENRRKILAETLTSQHLKSVIIAA